MAQSLYQKLLNPLEAALFLGVSVNTLAVWRSTGRHDLPFIKVGRCVRYDHAVLSAWLEAQTVTQTA